LEIIGCSSFSVEREKSCVPPASGRLEWHAVARRTEKVKSRRRFPGGMQPTRRDLLAGLGTAAAAGLAGCSGQWTAEGATFGATEAALSASVQRDTGYSHHRTEPFTVTREFGRFGLTRSVGVSNVVSEYDRAVELGFLGTRSRRPSSQRWRRRRSASSGARSTPSRRCRPSRSPT
jgi:hypothetical protein